MIVLTACTLFVLAIVAACFSRIVVSLVRQHARERDLMLNQIMHLSGNTWAPPPAQEEPPAPPASRTTLRSPEQLPDGFDFEAVA